jgi:hypothetical protein
VNHPLHILGECPQCGGDHDEDEDSLYACPGCGQVGSTACCMSDGADTLCEDCKDFDAAERYLED